MARSSERCKKKGNESIKVYGRARKYKIYEGGEVAPGGRGTGADHHRKHHVDRQEEETHRTKGWDTAAAWMDDRAACTAGADSLLSH